MIETELAQHLDCVGVRFRRLSTWRSLAICWFAVAVVAVLIWMLGRVLGQLPSETATILLLCATVAGIAAIIRSRRHARDLRWVARRIEERHPELQSLLLTAVDQRQAVPGGSDYLRQQVLQRAIEHAQRHDWCDVIPPWQIVRAQWAHWVAFSMMLLASVVLWGGSPRSSTADGAPGGGPSALAIADIAVNVVPGNVEVERGTGLVVTARFPDRAPREAKLVITPAESERETIAMQKALDDPVFGARIGSINADLKYLVEFDGQRTEPFSVTVFDYPRLLQADARIVFPDYANKPETVIEDVRQITAVEGSRITLTCRLNKAVESAQLVPDKGPHLVLVADASSPQDYSVEIVPRMSQEYSLKLVDEQGRENKHPPTITFTVLENRRPELKLTFPGRDLPVSPLEEMSIAAEVGDDFGVEAYGVVVAMAEAKPQTFTLGKQIEGVTSFEHEFHLEQLNAQPDQLLSYYIWADDYGPDGKLRRTSSDMYFAEVRHFDEIFRQGQSPPGGGGAQGGGAQGQQLDDLVRLQKQIVTATWKLHRRTVETREVVELTEDVSVVSESQQQALEKLEQARTKLQDRNSQAAAATAAEQMGKAIVLLNDYSETHSLLTAHSAERAAYQALLKLRAREHQVSKGQPGGGGGGGSSGRSQSQLQQLELAKTENRYENRNTAGQQQDASQRETNQLLNRLRELARRQSDLNQRIKELQSALQAPQTEKQREELKRRLKRLREEQRELLQNSDEVQERMQQMQQQQEAQSAQQQLTQTRENMRRASEALERGQLSQALNSGTRAQRELQQMRDEFRKKSAGAFADDMQQMREDARQLAEKQRELAEDMQKLNDADSKSLRDVREKDRVANELEQQRRKVEELLNQMREVSQAAENSEPLLTKQLYDTLRKIERQQPGRALTETRRQLDRGQSAEAEQAEARARESIDQLKTGVEKAAESVLGNETEALRRAKQELAELSRQLSEEIDGARSGRQSTEKPNEGKPSQQSNSQQSNSGNQPSSQQQNAQTPNGEGQGGQQASASNGNRGGQQPRNQRQRLTGPPQQPSQGRSQQDSDQGGGAGGPGGPITGANFREWSDRLRDVEEMVENNELRQEVAKIRDRARSARAEFKRHSKQPNWSMVEKLVAEPLVELQNRLREEIARRESPDALVPIDRDPVPQKYSEIVRRYYERLGSGK